MTSFIQFLVWIGVVVIMIFVGFFFNCLFRKPNISSLWDCFERKKSTPSVAPNVTPSVANNMLCEIEGEDLFNNKVYTRDGTLVTEQPDKLTCNECNKYVYKESSDECYDLGYDKELQTEGAVVGVCTAAFTKKSCPF